MTTKSHQRWEQLELFLPISNRPQWSQIPTEERNEIVRLLADMFRSRIQTDTLDCEREAGHE